MADKHESINQFSLEEEGTAVDAASTSELMQAQVHKRESTSMPEVCTYISLMYTESETFTSTNNF